MGRIRAGRMGYHGRRRGASCPADTVVGTGRQAGGLEWALGDQCRSGIGVFEVGLYPLAVAADEIEGRVMHEFGGLMDPTG